MEFILFGVGDEVFGETQRVDGAGGVHRDAFVIQDFYVERGVVGDEDMVFEEFLQAGLDGAVLKWRFVGDHFGGDVVDGHGAEGNDGEGGRVEVFVQGFAGGGVFVRQLDQAGVGGFVGGFGIEEEEGHGGFA